MMLNHPLIKPGTVVITHASRQPGPALARRFSQAGSDLVLLEDSRKEAPFNFAEIPSPNRILGLNELDVTKPEQCEVLVQQVWEQHGPVSVWINNLLGGSFSPAEELSWQAWQATISELLSGTFYCARTIGRKMLTRGGGVIINIVSIDAFMSIEGHLANRVASAGLIALTESLGIEWAGRGVRVVGIATSFQETGKLLVDSNRQEANENPPAGELLEAYRRRAPLRRLATPEDIAEAAYFLSSERAAYITGETLRVDGGWQAYQMF